VLSWSSDLNRRDLRGWALVGVRVGNRRAGRRELRKEVESFQVCKFSATAEHLRPGIYVRGGGELVAAGVDGQSMAEAVVNQGWLPHIPSTVDDVERGVELAPHREGDHTVERGSGIGQIEKQIVVTRRKSPEVRVARPRTWLVPGTTVAHRVAGQRGQEYLLAGHGCGQHEFKSARIKQAPRSPAFVNSSVRGIALPVGPVRKRDGDQCSR